MLIKGCVWFIDGISNFTNSLQLSKVYLNDKKHLLLYKKPSSIANAHSTDADLAKQLSFSIEILKIFQQYSIYHSQQSFNGVKLIGDKLNLTLYNSKKRESALEKIFISYREFIDSSNYKDQIDFDYQDICNAFEFAYNTSIEAMYNRLNNIMSVHYICVDDKDCSVQDILLYLETIKNILVDLRLIQSNLIVDNRNVDVFCKTVEKFIEKIRENDGQYSLHNIRACIDDIHSGLSMCLHSIDINHRNFSSVDIIPNKKIKSFISMYSDFE